jgi:hypothetical protein
VVQHAQGPGLDPTQNIHEYSQFFDIINTAFIIDLLISFQK